MTNSIQHLKVQVLTQLPFPPNSAPELFKLKMTPMHALARRTCSGVCLCLGLLSLPAHALSLGNLTVSSNASTSFTASLPFSDDKPVRLPELQTRLATDAEYAQWGMPMAPVVRELRVRVVPASQTVGYVELFSPTALSQDNFDLLVWASYAGQTMLTHYKVSLQDVPSLIKGKTLSTSQAPASTWPGQDVSPKAWRDKPPKAASAPKASVSASASVQASVPPPAAALPLEPLPLKPSAAPAPTEVVSASPSAQPAKPPSVSAAVNASPPTTADAQADSIWGSGALLLVFSLVLFLFGFLVGRMRSQPATHSLPGLSRHAAVSPSLSSARPPATPRRPTPAMPPGAQPFMPVFNTLPLIQPLPIAPLPVSPLPVSPLPVSPLPTPFTPVQPAKAEAPLPDPQPTQTLKPAAIADLAPPMPAPELPIVSEAPAAVLPSEVPETPAVAATVDARNESAQAPLETIVTPPAPPEPAAPRLHAEPVDVDVDEVSAQVPVASPPSNPVAAVTVVARTPATALPTPGLASGAGRTRKAGKTKSAGDSNIDLAKIYLSMGDPTTAQMVLQQVMEQGTEAEKAQAEQLMQEMV